MDKFLTSIAFAKEAIEWASLFAGACLSLLYLLAIASGRLDFLISKNSPAAQTQIGDTSSDGLSGFYTFIQAKLEKLGAVERLVAIVAGAFFAALFLEALSHVIANALGFCLVRSTDF